ncbi:MAG: tandem-95 repeat protein, partial [Candidatus Marinimicrobia bacterium]|nr:tandem-95 repeat protein [Candidatus Neomarinimicrobiota bacterium]
EVFYYDSDNDNLGSGESSEFCFGEHPDGWVQNNDDEYPDCVDNFYDDCGICGGDGSDDVGCGCFNPAALEYWYDSDGDEMGFGPSEEFCLQDLPEGWVLNNDDIEPNCSTNDTDYCGVCAGGGLNDLGCGCFELAPIGFCYDADGDGLGFGSVVEYCAVDIPESWVIDCSDTEPFCETNDTDDCNVCGGDNSSCTGCTDENAWNYCIDCTIEDGSCIFIPEAFNFSQSTAQAFYFVIDADISDVALNEYEDWIGVFNGDVCVGSRPWEGTFTSAPAMGDDGSEWTAGYLENGDYPTFKIFDASENTYFETEAINIYLQDQLSSREEYNGWVNFGFFNIERLRARLPDCVNVLDGNAYIDDCGECVGGTTDLADGWSKDCNGDCFGESYLDNCGICSEGNSGHSSNADDLGCGCFELAPENYWYDADGDSLGSGDPVSLCFDDVSEVWVQNGDDLEPFCSTNDTDECGVCAGNNNDMDCAGICFGTTLIDDCGECGGDGTSCLAPVANAQSIELFEDISSTIILSGYDPNSFPITEYTILTSPLNGSLTGELPTVIYIPDLNFNGEDSFQFVVSTNQFTSEPATISLTILPVNDAPIAYDIQENLEEDQSIEFQLIGFDIDGDELSYQITSGPYEGQAELIGSNVTYTPNQNYYGLDSFDFIVNDGQINSNTATGFLTINSTNDFPVIESIENQETLENESLVLNVNATDEDDDFLIYSATVDGNASVIVNGSELNIIPDYNYNGVIIISVNVTDGFGVVSEEFTLTVLPVNNPPEFSTIPSQSTNEDVEIDIELIATDPDGDELIYSVDDSDNATYTINGNVLSISLNENYYGQFIATVFVSDGEYSDSTSFTVNVNSVNDAPEFIFVDNQNGLEDVEFSLELVAADIEGDDITFSASADGNSQIEIIDNLLVVIPNENFNGDINISIFASDGLATDSELFMLSVNPVNDSPQISIINDIIIDEDNSTTFRILATDIDGDALTYSASGLDVSFEYDDDLVTVHPNENLSGVVEITATAADDELQVSTIFNLIINEVNDAPVIISEIEDLELNQNGEDFTIDLTDHFYDVENGNNLEYSIFENHPAIIASVENNNMTLSIVENIIGSGFI